MTLNEIKDLRYEFFDNAETHFMIFDNNLNIIDVNESLLNYYHATKDQLVGKNFLEVSPEAKEKGLYDTYMNVLKTGTPVFVEDTVSIPLYGNQINKLKAFKVGDSLGVTASNITELKNTIEALEIFSHRISHDVHSPMANIMGLTELALDKDANIEEIRSYCGMISECVIKLNNTVEMVNQTLKMQKNDFVFEPIDFETVLNEVKSSLMYIDGFSSIRFEVKIDPVNDFYFDKQMVISMFQNLIDNAIKYRKLDSTDSFVRITISGDENYINITFADNGIGIASEQQKNIFKLFHRATTQGKGNGVGLYTLKFGIQKLGGNLTFESSQNIGTTFTVLLPNKKNRQKVSAIN
jgi:signal transduction histidine kinase